MVTFVMMMWRMMETALMETAMMMAMWMIIFIDVYDDFDDDVNGGGNDDR